MKKSLAFIVASLAIAACSRNPNKGKAEADPLPESAACPHLQIKAPDSVSAGTRAQIEVDTIASTAPGAPATAPAPEPTFQWSVNAGMITDGQGTPSITVDTSGLSGKSLIASVEVSGLPRACATTTAQATTLIVP
jgi:hypothetical protein